MTKYRIPLIFLFVLIVVVQLVGSWTESSGLEYWAKPWIMVWITAWFLMFSRKKSFATEVVLAFFFCWVGDVLLMLADTFEILFYAGVGAFFIGQLFYIRLFIRHSENNQPGLIKRQPLILLPYLAYLLGILIILFPVVEGPMKIIISVYGASLVGMAVAAVNRHQRVSKPVFIRVMLGSIFFVLSDSLIAINKFYTDFDKSGFVIMATYIIAQVLILSGLVIEKEKD